MSPLRYRDGPLLICCSIDRGIRILIRTSQRRPASQVFHDSPAGGVFAMGLCGHGAGLRRTACGTSGSYGDHRCPHAPLPDPHLSLVRRRTELSRHAGFREKAFQYAERCISVLWNFIPPTPDSGIGRRLDVDVEGFVERERPREEVGRWLKDGSSSSNSNDAQYHS